VVVAEPWYALTVGVLRPSLALYFNWRFEGLEQVPRTGPLLVAANHISELDPLAHGYFLVKAGRRPRFLGKSELWRNALLRPMLRGTRQIPVHRGTGEATPVETAVERLRRGECVVVYPEATLTKNPDYSPMRAKTGIARVAIEASVPVLPVAAWGTHKVLPRHGEQRNLAWARPIMVKAGPPLDLSRYEDDEDRGAYREATDEVMAELSGLVSDLRARYPKRWA